MLHAHCAYFDSSLSEYQVPLLAFDKQLPPVDFVRPLIQMLHFLVRQMDGFAELQRSGEDLCRFDRHGGDIQDFARCIAQGDHAVVLQKDELGRFTRAR